MESSGISKKEYLKKYLSGGEKKKKKKKSTQSLIIKSRIVDDDLDLKNMKPVNSDELEIYDLGEEAPQIVGIIDERPAEVRLMSEYRSSKKWKIVTDEYGIEDVKITAIDRRKSDDGSPKLEKEISIEITKNSERKISTSDESVPEKKRTPRTENNSIPINKVIKKEIDSDSSPPRKSKKNNHDSDASPPRKAIKKEKEDSVSRKKNVDSDASPPRKSKHKKDYDSDASPPKKSQKKNYDSDACPPRRRRKDTSPLRSRRRKDSSNSSPRRKRGNYSDSSPPRKSESSKKQGSSHHKTKHEKSGHRRKSKSLSTERSISKKSNDYGLKVNSNQDSSSRKEKKSSELQKTLSGKKAGLQSAEEMRKESQHFREREKEMFEKMSDDLTGKHAAAVVRNKKTGRRHDAKEEARKKREKEEKEAEKIAQYAVWGKGVKQVRDREDKLKNDLYEMSKPLARYKDDKDLEEMLKNQERDGDPMLEYIRRKRKPEPASSRPEYEGNYLPNRYNIKPGHKWDGVDRSNGYEKKWFEEQNAKKAREEEAFKWSTYDM